MYNPEHQEKHLAPMDVKIKTRTTVVTIIMALAIIAGVIVIAEIFSRAISSLRGV